jgi:hypothetical protein
MLAVVVGELELKLNEMARELGVRCLELNSR